MNKDDVIRAVLAERICSALEPKKSFDRQVERLFLFSKIAREQKAAERKSAQGPKP